MRIVTTLCVLGLLGVAACSQTGSNPDHTRPDLPADFAPQTLATQESGKTDALTNWYVSYQAPVASSMTINKASTKPWQWFHGYPFKLNKGDAVTVKAEGNYWGLVLLYARHGNSWGSPVAWDTIGWQSVHQAYTVKLPQLTAKTNGEYLLVIGSPWRRPYTYSVSLTTQPAQTLPTCQTGGCSGQLCVNADDVLGGSGLITTCDYKEIYTCLQYTQCGNFGPEGACAWDANQEYLDCLDQMTNGCHKTGYSEVSVADLTADPKAYDGKQVLLCGSAQKGPMFCTLMACVLPNTCCNSCGAGLQLADGLDLSGAAGEHWGCGGNECNQTCTPFSEEIIGNYRCYYGTYEKSQYGDYGQLKVDGYLEHCPQSKGPLALDPQ